MIGRSNGKIKRKGRTMTREEAIKKINAIKKYLITGNPIWDVKEIDEVLNMAIEALEQEPVVRCKDCIHGEEMKKPWADGRQIVFCWKHGKERFTTSDWYCANGERAKE